MAEVLNNLLDLLRLEQTDEHTFIGHNQDLGFPQVFGGQVIGQALSAAKATLPASRKVNSFHSYFLRPGDVHELIQYRVDIIRDGNTFSTRRVEAVQHGKSIFFMTASFQLEEPGFQHQDIVMPDAPDPEGLQSELDFARANADKIPKPLREKYICEKPIEIRPVTTFNPLFPKRCEPHTLIWFKANGEMPDDLRIHKYLLAYASDFYFLPTAGQPHGISFLQPTIQMATIDHAMWFHRDFRFDDWLLYQVHSPVANGGRGLVRGEFFSRDGQLVATTVQEGVMRHYR